MNCEKDKIKIIKCFSYLSQPTFLASFEMFRNFQLECAPEFHQQIPENIGLYFRNVGFENGTLENQI